MMKESEGPKTSLEDVRTKSKPEGPVLEVCKWILLWQYAVVGFAIFLILCTVGKVPFSKNQNGGKEDTDKKVQLLRENPNISDLMLHAKAFIKLMTIKQSKDSSFLARREKTLLNPFKLSSDEVAEQMESAKIPSLKNRVKRFACWHSCFGQFRKKAIRTLYGVTKPPVIPTLRPPTSPTVAPNGTEEKKASKRETLKAEETSTGTLSGTENNELGEGEGKGDSTADPAQETSTAKLSTDFFKLKTKEKESTTMRDTSTDSSIAGGTQHSKENVEGYEKEIVVSKDLPSHVKKGRRKVVVETVEESESDEDGEDDEESESAENDSEVSLSEEATEDKGDGIDKKDLEEKRR